MTRPTHEEIEQLLRTAYDRTSALETRPTPRRTGPSEAARGRYWSAPVTAAAAATVAVLLLIGGRVMFDRSSQPSTPAPNAATAQTSATGPPAAQVWRASAATVLGSSGQGEARVCVGPMTASPTPECSGPIVAPWDWSLVKSTHSGRVQWGTYDLTGTWDGERLTLTEPPLTSTDTRDVATANLPNCPPPPDGWGSPDPGKVADDDLAAAQAAARSLPTFGAQWVRTPAAANHPVLNVAVTRDATGAEETVRQHWGGPLCVLQATRTQAELAKAETELRSGTHAAEILQSSTSLDHVYVTVFVDPDHALQSQVDQQFGSDVVRVTAVLEPAR